MEFSEFKKKISESFEDYIGTCLSDKQCQDFFDFMNLLIEKNKVMNLTAITDPDEIILKHFVDSSILVKFYGKDFFDGKFVIDVGTGAGFPGLPLAIICPKAKFVLSDTLGKRIEFIRAVLLKLQLNNIELIKSRAEDLGRNAMFREKFDYSVSRAVSNISVLSEYTLPLIKVRGRDFLFKMDDCDQELKDGDKSISTLGGKFHVKHSYELIQSEPKRCILEIEKVKSTPKQFPRKAGTPSKNPIK
jgi:16S rRNA (guanine527-N7)-methyltransferase